MSDDQLTGDRIWSKDAQIRNNVPWTCSRQIEPFAVVSSVSQTDRCAEVDLLNERAAGVPNNDEDFFR